MSMIGKSIAVNLKVSDANVVSIDKQEIGFAKGVVNEVIGTFDGGLTTSVGLSHTAVEAAKMIAPAVIEHRIQTGGWGVPFKSPV